jgi:excisionase family DNA binding protein
VIKKTESVTQTARSGGDLHVSSKTAGAPAVAQSATALHDRLMCSIPEAAFSLGIGRTSVYGLINRGALRAVKLGTRTLIPTEDVLRFAAELAGCRDALAGRGH